MLLVPPEYCCLHATRIFEQLDLHVSALARALLFDWFSARCHLICALYVHLLPCPLSLRMGEWYGRDPQVVVLVVDLYKSPVHFEAVFDGEVGAVDLLRPLLGERHDGISW